jgi:hypothetical protein
MNSNFTPHMAHEHVADMQRAAERERNIRSARARMTGSRRPRINLLAALSFRPAQQA